MKMFRQHPKGLYVLFFTEMWERFSFYGMRALLVYYMTKQLLFSQEMSSQVYGLYTGFVYFTPFFGGIIADRFWGQRKTVVVGGVLMAIGHFLMAFESLFYPALLFLILGNGLFKPNISTQVGNLYPEGDPRRDSAFSVFYVGINLGAFFAPLVCGTLGEIYGWHWGFGAAGVGMLIGLVVYLWGQQHLAPDNVMKKSAQAEATQPLTVAEKNKIWALIVLCALNVVFWSTYEQQGNTMALWADNNTDRMIFGWEVPASWFQSVNPFVIFALTPVITWLWSWQARRNKEPGSIGKMAIGCFILGISFLIMLPPAFAMSEGGAGKASMIWLLMNTVVLTIGELYLSPVGLSLVTKLAPARMVSMLMGVWFLSSFVGNYLSGYIGTFWEKMPKSSFFIMLTVITVAAGFAMVAVSKPLKNMGVKDV